MQIGMQNRIFRIPYDDAGGVCQHRDSGMTANTNQSLTGKHDKLRFMCSQVAGTISKFREILNQTKKCEILH